MKKRGVEATKKIESQRPHAQDRKIVKEKAAHNAIVRTTTVGGIWGIVAESKARPRYLAGIRARGGAKIDGQGMKNENGKRGG